ncbi:MAG: DUF1579 family protein [Candidatus Zixiibacteriota bacterium]
MKKLLLCTAMLAMVLCFAALIIAADEKAAPAGQPPAGMPPMGPPSEMKELAPLVGNWTCTMKMKMDPSTEQWMETKMTSKCAYMLDGAALTMEHESVDLMMGMKFKGFGIETYDREKKQWQMTWTDNMSGRTSMYIGERTAAGMTMTGEDMMGGMTSLTRITTSNMTPTSYDWKMEMSLDQGKTWMAVGTATYTKAK